MKKHFLRKAGSYYRKICLLLLSLFLLVMIPFAGVTIAFLNNRLEKGQSQNSGLFA